MIFMSDLLKCLELSQEFIFAAARDNVSLWIALSELQDHHFAVDIIVLSFRVYLKNATADWYVCQQRDGDIF